VCGAIVDDIELSRALLLSTDGWKQLQSGFDHVNFVCQFCRAIEVLHAIAIFSCGVRKAASQNIVVCVVYVKLCYSCRKNFLLFHSSICPRSARSSYNSSYISVTCSSISLRISFPRSIAIIPAITLTLSISTKFSSFFLYSSRETFHSPSSLATSYFAYSSETFHFPYKISDIKVVYKSSLSFSSEID